MVNRQSILVMTFPYKAVITLIGACFVPFLILSIIYLLIVSPLICKYYIVPGIEKKTGKILGFSPLLGMFIYGRYFDRQVEISRYILDRYFAWKKYGEKGVPFGYELFALKHVGYSIEMMTKVEIMYAFSVRISIYVGFASVLIIFVAAILNGN